MQWLLFRSWDTWEIPWSIKSDLKLYMINFSPVTNEIFAHHITFYAHAIRTANFLGIDVHLWYLQADWACSSWLHGGNLEVKVVTNGKRWHLFYDAFSCTIWSWNLFDALEVFSRGRDKFIVLQFFYRFIILKLYPSKW